MPNDTPPPHLLDAVKASASKLKEKQAVLDARAKELETLKVRLDAERAEIEKQVASLAADRASIDRERDGLDDVRAGMERDLAGINDGREQLTKDQERLQTASKALEDRERAIEEGEGRLERLAEAFKGEMMESESRLRALIERGAELTKMQTDWLAAFETRQKELDGIGREMRARHDELVQQDDSLTRLKDAFRDEVNRLLTERDALAAKERSILEAEKYLSTALQIAESDFEEERPPATPPPAPAPPEPVAPPPPEPMPSPEPIASREEIPVDEEIPRPTEAKRPATRTEAMDRLTQAVEAWKRARDAGFKVTDIRKTVKSARAAVDAGEYEAAIAMTVEILDQLQATALTR